MKLKGGEQGWVGCSIEGRGEGWLCVVGVIGRLARLIARLSPGAQHSLIKTVYDTLAHKSPPPPLSPSPVCATTPTDFLGSPDLQYTVRPPHRNLHAVTATPSPYRRARGPWPPLPPPASRGASVPFPPPQPHIASAIRVVPAGSRRVRCLSSRCRSCTFPRRGSSAVGAGSCTASTGRGRPRGARADRLRTGRSSATNRSNTLRKSMMDISISRKDQPSDPVPVMMAWRGWGGVAT